jgi:hypothetical protein
LWFWFSPSLPHLGLPRNLNDSQPPHWTLPLIVTWLPERNIWIHLLLSKFPNKLVRRPWFKLTPLKDKLALWVLALIPRLTDQNPYAQSRVPMEMIFQG